MTKGSWCSITTRSGSGAALATGYYRAGLQPAIPYPPFSLKGWQTVAVGKRSAAHGFRNPTIHSTLKGSHSPEGIDDPFRVVVFDHERLVVFDHDPIRWRRCACHRLLQRRPSACDPLLDFQPATRDTRRRWASTTVPAVSTSSVIATIPHSETVGMGEAPVVTVAAGAPPSLKVGAG